jgi:tetratricopeptide (TPR) repeat protein
LTDLRTRLQSLLDADYAIERELGGGGMSRVFVATEKRLGRRVVIKVLSPDLAATLSTGRFQREIQLAASLQQANIVPVLAAGEADGMPWYTMPFVEGESLRARLARGPLSEREALSVLRDVARALVYAHERAIVHRDIKPDNVLLSGEAAVVTDFGIAKAISAARTQAGPAATGITQVGTSLGTPTYMAPEQAAGDPNTDHRADIYAFGVMAFELLTGRPPFVESAPHKLLAAHLSQPAPRLRDALGSANAALDTLLATCLEKQPGDRPQTARDLLAQLDAAVSGSGSGAASIALTRQTSLPRALGIWAGSFVAIWILSRAAVVGIGLPDWTVPLALIVGALGLPAVLVTWYVQHTARNALLTTPQHTPGGTQVHTTMATMALKVAPHVSWKRTWRGGMLAGGGVATAIAAVMILRQFGIGPAASLLGAGAIDKDSRVLVAQFTSSTTDTSLGSVVAAAMRTSLSQSRAVQLVGAGDVAAGLTRMKMDAGASLDEKTAQLLALRDGVPLIVTGSVSPVGAGYMITANLVRADSGVALFTVQQGASGAGDILQAVDKVARGMRSRIGESLKSIARAPSLERATTTSLTALREYSRALEAGDLRGDWVQGIARLRAALAEDSTFAMAWRKLAVYEFNNGAPRSAIATANAAAFRFRERLPDIERADVEVYYHRERSTRRGLELYRENPSLSQNNRAIGHNAFGEYAVAESVLVAEIARQESLGKKPIVQLYTNLIVAQLGAGRVDAARQTVETVRREFPGSFSHLRMERWMAGVVGPDSMAKLAADHARRSPIAGNRAEAARMVANTAIARGQLRAAAQLSRVASLVEDSAQYNADPVTNAALDIVAASALRRSEAAGLRRLDSLASAAGTSKQPVMDRPDLAIAIAYAQLGNPARARTILSEFDRAATHDDRMIRWADLQVARGEIALAEGRATDAITAFRTATFSDSGQVEPIGWGGTHLRLARAFDRANQPDSALAQFEAFQTPLVRAAAAIFAPTALPVAARRRGELYEARGDIANAIKNYEEFVALWKDADPDLQPQVAEIKSRLARLRAAEARRR